VLRCTYAAAVVEGSSCGAFRRLSQRAGRGCDQPAVEAPGPVAGGRRRSPRGEDTRPPSANSGCDDRLATRRRHGSDCAGALCAARRANAPDHVRVGRNPGKNVLLSCDGASAG